MLTSRQRAALDALRTSAPVLGRLATLFADAGHELYLVGGPVRDALLGRGNGIDLDFTTSAQPDQIEALLKKISKATWDMGRAFGTIGTAVKGPDGNRLVVEITTFRADSYDPESRKPTVSFGDHLGADLVRRDFTVNAMALRVADGEFFDPFGGLVDLEERTLRTPATAELSFSDDPLRMMRAARFASQLEFIPDADVVKAMTDMAERIDIVSAERVRDELTKLMLSDRPRLGLDLLTRTGLADRVIPELPALRMEGDEHNRHKNVYEHTLTVIDQAIDLEKARGHAPDLIVRLAALFHDVGKPKTRRFEQGGKVSFHHHDVVGAKLTRRRMEALRFSSDEIKAVSELVELHLRFHGYGDGAWTDSAVRRYVRDAGDQLERLHILTRADCTTRNPRKAARLAATYEQLEHHIDALAEQEELESIRPDLDGTQIMELLDIRPGPVVGEAYRFMMELRMDEGPLGPEVARERLLAWWAARP